MKEVERNPENIKLEDLDWPVKREKVDRDTLKSDQDFKDNKKDREKLALEQLSKDLAMDGIKERALVEKEAGQRRERETLRNKSRLRREGLNRRLRQKTSLRGEASKGVKEKESSPIRFFEYALIVPVLVVADFVDILNFTGAGVIVSWFVDGLVLGFISIWLLFRGKKATWFIAAGIAEFIPGIDVFPIRLTIFTIMFLMENQTFKSIFISKEGGLVSKITKVLPKK